MNHPEVLAEVDAECRRRSIPMLGPQKAQRLVEWIREARPNLVVEVGTAIGYSGLWVADTLREAGCGQTAHFRARRRSRGRGRTQLPAPNSLT